MGEEKIDQKKTLGARDIFIFLQREAAEMDLDEIKTVQKHPKRQAFVQNLVGYVQNYNQENSVMKPTGYYAMFKTVLSSKTTELLKLIELCQKNDFAGFVAAMKNFDLEALRRMDKIPRDNARADIPKILKGQGRAAMEVLASQSKEAIDVRADAARRRANPDWN